MKTCLYRFLKECKNCSPDYNLSHHPNNYDCPRYHEINILEFVVEEKQKKPKNFLKKFVLEKLKSNSSVEELLKKVI